MEALDVAHTQRRIAYLHAMDDDELRASVTSLLRGDAAPTRPPAKKPAEAK